MQGYDAVKCTDVIMTLQQHAYDIIVVSFVGGTSFRLVEQKCSVSGQIEK